MERRLVPKLALLIGISCTAWVVLGSTVGIGSSVAEPLPVPEGPLLGQACSDLDKLAYDPSAGQIACNGGEWVRSAQPTGVRNIGTPCAPGELDSLMASTSDGHLIWCPSYVGTWTLFRE